MRTVAVLPVKTFPRAKTRIGTSLSDSDRVLLAEAMVADVLDALAAVHGLDAILMVTGEPRAAAAATRVGAQVLPDPDEPGHSAAAAAGAAWAADDGAERVLLVPGDCPALDPLEVDELLETDAPGLVIVPDRHGTGTNALLMAPPTLMRPSFGDGSCARHAALATGIGVPVRIAAVASLALDVDTPADLDALRQGLSEHPGAAPCTRAVLARLAPAPQHRAS